MQHSATRSFFHAPFAGLILAILTILATCLPFRPALGQGVSVNANFISEPQRHGLAEANGRPGVGINVDWELNDYLFVAANGYITGDGPAPQRTRNIAPLIGLHLGNAEGTQFDFMFVHRIFPGDFVIDWDFSELQMDIGLTPSFGVSFTATDNYYGLDLTAISGAVEYVHNFSDRLYARLKVGHVDVDSSAVESFSFGVTNLGYRFDRLSVEAGYRANNADAFVAFREPQTRNRFMLTVNWAVY